MEHHRRRRRNNKRGRSRTKRKKKKNVKEAKYIVMDEDRIRELHEDFKDFVEVEISDDNNKSLTIKPFNEKKIGHECYTVILDNVSSSVDLEHLIKKVKEFDREAFAEISPTIDGKTQWIVQLPILEKNHKYKEKKPIKRGKKDLNSKNSYAIRWLLVFLISTVLFLLTMDFKNIIQ